MAPRASELVNIFVVVQITAVNRRLKKPSVIENVSEMESQNDSIVRTKPEPELRHWIEWEGEN